MLPETVFGGYESDQFLFQTFSATKGEAMFLSHCCPSCPGNNAAITIYGHSQQQYNTSPGWSMTALGPPTARSLKISTSSWRPMFVFVFVCVEFVFFPPENLHVYLHFHLCLSRLAEQSCSHLLLAPL